MILFFFSSRRRHTRLVSDWSSDVCSSDLVNVGRDRRRPAGGGGRSESAGGGGPALPRGASARSRDVAARSEERRVGKECRCGGGECRLKKKVGMTQRWRVR